MPKFDRTYSVSPESFLNPSGSSFFDWNSEKTRVNMWIWTTIGIGIGIPTWFAGRLIGVIWFFSSWLHLFQFPSRSNDNWTPSCAELIKTYRRSTFPCLDLSCFPFFRQIIDLNQCPEPIYTELLKRLEQTWYIIFRLRFRYKLRIKKKGGINKRQKQELNAKASQISCTMHQLLNRN